MLEWMADKIYINKGNKEGVGLFLTLIHPDEQRVTSIKGLLGGTVDIYKPNTLRYESSFRGYEGMLAWFDTNQHASELLEELELAMRRRLKYEKDNNARQLIIDRLNFLCKFQSNWKLTRKLYDK